jgi:hypothetical protein
MRQNDRGAKIAIAYWGSESLKLLHLNSKKRNVRVLCCLKGGKSDPAVIGRFGDHARQHDKLHAKMIWTRYGAVVGSANASSNGLPEEEYSGVGLIEASVFIKEAVALKEIERWFDGQYNSARRITKSDLKSAELERNRRLWTGGRGSRQPQRNLLRAMQEP